jgi:iron transport multicopper oxidase
MGNAAGNTQDLLNLTGAPTLPETNPVGALIDASTLGPPGKRHAHWAHHGGKHNKKQ